MEARTPRSPTLETLLMIEDFAREHSGEYTKTQLWKNLPRKVMYQTFCAAFDYLLRSNKIALDPRNNHVIWIWDEAVVRKILLRREAGRFVREVTRAPPVRLQLTTIGKRERRSG